MRVRRILALLPAALLVLSATGPSAHAAGRVLTVEMKSFVFSPASVTVHVGDTVKWVYAETATDIPPGCENPIFQSPAAQCPGHSTTSAAHDRHGKPVWDSGVHRASGFPFSVRFARAGTFNYFCVVHGGTHSNNPLTKMNGTVVVQR